jgi:amidase
VADPCFRPASALADALRRREISCRDLLERYLDRVAAVNPRLNAVVTLDAERARKRADEADAALVRGESWGPLHGLPMTVKDSFETAGLRTTSGSPSLASHVPDRDALAVERLARAGAVIFGKTNLPSFAMDWQSYNDLHGTTNNPWDPQRSPGGSSGGSAAAVAAGLSALELGSDIGGSIRIPSHCCGVFGHKPTWGLVPVQGHIPPASGTLAEDDINVVGPLARAAEDLELALGVLAGPAPDRAAAWRLELPPPRHAALSDYRVAVWLDDPFCPTDSAVRTCLEQAAAALRRAGARVDDQARPDFSLAEAVDLYRRLLSPITAGALPPAVIERLQTAAGAEPALQDLARMGMISHVEWLTLNEQRERQRAAWAAFFRDVDVLLCPVSPFPAVVHDHSEPLLARRLQIDGVERAYTDQFTWMGPIGACWLPATAAPVGRTAQGLPVGAQIVAAHLEDRTSIDFAGRLTRELGGYEPPPGF